MKKYSKIIAYLAAASMTAGLLAGCGNKTTVPTVSDDAQSSTATSADASASTDSSEATAETGTGAAISTLVGVEEDTTPAAEGYASTWTNESYQAESSELYNLVLGEYYDYYQQAMEAETISERYALMAVAEAKMLESGIFVPMTTRGGVYAMSRLAPGSVTSTLWGNDEYRFHNAIATTELIKAEDIAALRAKLAELRGTGEYREWAKQYLTDAGYTLKDSYNYPNTSDPITWDVLATSSNTDTAILVNLYDGLYEYDAENVQQPALAESYTVSDDGLTYTFKIREGVKWVDSQGREVAELTADDFVAGMQHMMDAMGGLEYLVDGVIVGATDYINGASTDFSTVGVKAVDDYTLEYTLEEPTPYFTTMLSYSVFAPLSRAYYEGQGGTFGQGYTAGQYGTDSDHIAYCGPFLITSFTEKNSIVFKANPSYWNAENQDIQSITYVYEDLTDATKVYKDVVAGTVDGASLDTADVETAKKDGNFDQYVYVSNTEGTTYCGFLNINRKAFANFNDASKAISDKTVYDAQRTALAMQNQDFRLAIVTALDRATHNAQRFGEDVKYNNLRNSFTPGNFVSLEEEVTIDINGTATTFPAGTYFGEIEQAQITADGFPITVWDPTKDEGAGSSDGFDGWYNPEFAMEEITKAAEALAEVGVEVSAENPIQVDLPYFSGSEVYTNRANVLKQSIETSTGGLIQINLVKCESSDDWSYAGYYPSTGYEVNGDLTDTSGWGPDYGDPSTYLNTMLPDYAGYMTKNLGLF